MEVVQNPTLGAVANFLRKEGLTMEISYGSGGFCVVLKLLKTPGITQFAGFGWDVQYAFDNAVANFKEFQENSSAKDEDTAPGAYKMKVNSLSPERKKKN